MRYQMPRQQPGSWYARWLAEDNHAELLPMSLERIKQEGALRASDFDYHGPRRGSWWDWKPAKAALEYRYALGDLMIANRVNFQRGLTAWQMPIEMEKRKSARLTFREALLEKQAENGIFCKTPSGFCGSAKKSVITHKSPPSGPQSHRDAPRLHWRSRRPRASRNGRLN